MKKSLFKDSIREIKKTFSRFMAILAIVAISVAFFTGIKITCPDMKNTADVYYDEFHLMDFKLVSTVGFNSADVDAIRKIPEIKGVSPSYTLDAVLDAKDSNSVVRIHSLEGINSRSGEDYINRPMLIEGRLPSKSGECLIEKSGFFTSMLSLNTKIKLMSGKENEKLDFLKTDAFTAVGIIRSPLYVSKDRGTSTIGTGKISSFIFINQSDFNMPVYNTLYLTVKSAEKLKTYSSDYDDLIKSVAAKIEKVASSRAQLRFDEIKVDALKILSNKQTEYDKAVADSNKKFADAEQEIKNNEKKIADGQALLNKNLADFKRTIKTSKEQLDAADATLLVGYKEYDTKYAQFVIAKQNAIDTDVYGMQMAYFQQIESQLLASKTTLDTNKAVLADKRAELVKSEKMALKTFNTKQIEITKSKQTLSTAKDALAKGKETASIKLADGKKELLNAKKDIDAIPIVKWHVLDRNTNAGYVDYGGAADRMNAIAEVFPLIFILVGILICFTAMGRMVDEQRGFIGTIKALGYSKASIAGKYLLYAALASFIGGLAGVFVGFSFFPSFIFKAFSALYTLPKLILVFDVPFAIYSIGVAIMVTTAAALIVCFEELHKSAAQLMRPKSPKPGKIILLERIPFIWKRMKFTQKVTARNILRYKSRFFMTVFGVAGCTALLLVGFGLHDSISDIGIKQFRDINTYQMVVNIKENITTEEINNINSKIEANSHFDNRELFMSNSITIGRGELQKDCGLLVPEKLEQLGNFISLHERISRKTVPLTDEGVVITEKLARKIGAVKGDEIYVKTSEYDKKYVKVIGICENYLNHYLYMSPKLYESIFNKKANFNSIYVNLKNITQSDEESISGLILSQEGVAAVYNSSDMLTRFKDTIKSVNYVVLILIFSAGLLSFIVLYTLTNININERMREIATIKVLGFYDREVSAYVFKENIILTFIGTGIGLVLGYYLSMFVIQTAEVDVIMFGREIYALSFIFSSLLTIFFALFVNVVMLRKIKNINMVEALKTVE